MYVHDKNFIQMFKKCSECSEKQSLIIDPVFLTATKLLICRYARFSKKNKKNIHMKLSLKKIVVFFLESKDSL